MDIIRIIITILLPPLGVFLQVGLGKHFWINILLTLLGYFPGLVHAIWVIAKKWAAANSDIYLAKQLKLRKRLENLAWLLDSSLRLPGGFRVGLDGIIGLIPGVGDLIGAALSSYIVLVAVKLKLPFRLLARMTLNILVDLVIGIVPIFGDIFDFSFKANVRNVRLLNQYLSKTREESVTTQA